MAKDGTNRGGARPGAGRKKKALSEKIASGNPGHRPLKMLDPVAIDTVDMPPPAEYLSAEQRDGSAQKDAVWQEPALCGLLME